MPLPFRLAPLLLLVFAHTATAQSDLNVPAVDLEIPADEAFHRTLDFLVSQNYTIAMLAPSERLVTLYANSNVQMGRGDRTNGQEENYRVVTLRFVESGAGAARMLVGHRTERVYLTGNLLRSERSGPERRSQQAALEFIGVLGPLLQP